MVKKNWVEKIILGIIGLNIMVLMCVFLIPRAQFILSNWELKPDALMETLGAIDTPNQYSRTYKVANAIRNITKQDSIILMPTDNWEFGSNRSVVIQRLYPRKVYFFGDGGFYDYKTHIDFKTTVYAVAFPGDNSNLCFEEKIEKLRDTGFVICRNRGSN